MNVGNDFDYNNHIALISAQTKIGTPQKGTFNCVNGSDFTDLAL